MNVDWSPSLTSVDESEPHKNDGPRRQMIRDEHDDGSGTAVSPVTSASPIDMSAARWRSSRPAVELWSLRQRLRWARRPPRTLNEKIRYKMAADRSSLLTVFADKVRVRDYVHAKAGADVLSVLYFNGADPALIPWNTLPTEFVIKANHGCGATIVVREDADPSALLPRPDRRRPWGVHAIIHPDALTSQRSALSNLTTAWLSTNYWRAHGVPEWGYKNVMPQVLVEELLLTPTRGVPVEYTFYCCNGRARFIKILMRTPEHREDIYLPDWTRIPVGDCTEGAPADIAAPPRLADMIDLAERLSDGVDFVRVDLYNIGERIIFREMTNYPTGGNNPELDAEVFARLSESWQPRYRR